MLRLLIALLGISGMALLALTRLLRRKRPKYPSAETLITTPQVEIVATRLNATDYELAWLGTSQRARVYASRQPDHFDHHAPVAEVFGENDVIVRGLVPAPRYYFEVLFDGAELDGERLVVSERILPMEGAANFRDIGGYRTEDGRRTRWGRVYRSGALGALTEADQHLLQQLGIRLVCDLRSPDEVQEDPDRLPTTGRITYANLPVHTEMDTSRMRQLRVLLFNQQQLGTLLPHTYKKVLIDGNGELFGDVMRRLAVKENLPTIIHCTAGKDRAGLATALLLLALGVPEETVIADYTLSNLYFANFRQYAKKVVKPFAVLGITEDDLYPLLIADAHNLRDTLQYVRENYGSVRAYLKKAAGIDETVLAQIEANLLE